MIEPALQFRAKAEVYTPICIARSLSYFHVFQIGKLRKEAVNENHTTKHGNGNQTMKNNIKVSCLVWILACYVLLGLVASPVALAQDSTKQADKWQFSKVASAKLAYRYLYQDFEKDNFVWDMAAHGPMIGIGFHF